MNNCYIVRPDELYHHGVKGQKWGVRNYQNYDGTLTSKGKARLIQKKRASNNNSSDYNWNSGRNAEQRLRCWNFADDGRKSGFDPYDIETDRINVDEMRRWISAGGEYVNDPETFDDYVENTVRPFFGDEFADIYSDLMYENTEKIAAMENAEKKIVPQINALAAGMPTSAIKARDDAKKAAEEAKIKENIPASAWNERSRALNGGELKPQNKLGRIIKNPSSGMPSSAIASQKKSHKVPIGIPTSVRNEQNKTVSPIKPLQQRKA